MKTYKEILKEAKKEFIHVVNDNNKEHDVIHSVHDNPRLGGQQLKSFKNDKAAMDFAIKQLTDKNITGIRWNKKGEGANAKWKKTSSFTASTE